MHRLAVQALLLGQAPPQVQHLVAEGNKVELAHAIMHYHLGALAMESELPLAQNVSSICKDLRKGRADRRRKIGMATLSARWMLIHLQHALVNTSEWGGV